MVPREALRYRCRRPPRRPVANRALGRPASDMRSRACRGDCQRGRTSELDRNGRCRTNLASPWPRWSTSRVLEAMHTDSFAGRARCKPESNSRHLICRAPERARSHRSRSSPWRCTPPLPHNRGASEVAARASLHRACVERRCERVDRGSVAAMRCPRYACPRCHCRKLQPWAYRSRPA